MNIPEAPEEMVWRRRQVSAKASAPFLFRSAS